jgi:bifunctional UDP-N-acetylglucosamine pyrophosphorylase / glucosamine-1-phosphate N-acetyltransferase
MRLSAIILAAGEGKRMLSSIPKALHCLAGKPLLEHVVETAQKIIADEIFVVYGHGGEQVRKKLKHLPVTWVKQAKQGGTGHAVLQVLPQLKSDHRALILYGDTPLISTKTLSKFLDETPENSVGWLTSHIDDPFGLGRIVRDEDQNPVKIVEEKDATEQQKAICEINTGVCLVPVDHLRKWLPNLGNNNAQKEYYLTDIFAMALADGVRIVTTSAESTTETLGINSNDQLAFLERVFQRELAKKYMQEGLTLLDPSRFDVRGTLTFGKDVVVDINVIIKDEVSIGSNCYIGPNVILRDVVVGDNVEINANSVIDSATIGNHCFIGPFSRIRPETKIKDGAKIGNFVEIKKSEIGEKSKINHLTYIGDTVMGGGVNIGAGSVTCNYDGVNKHKTIIEDDVFVGSDTKLIAPIKIGKGATIGAGSTITNDVPPKYLTLSRSKQVTIEEWKRPTKDKKKD